MVGVREYVSQVSSQSKGCICSTSSPALSNVTDLIELIRWLHSHVNHNVEQFVFIYWPLWIPYMWSAYSSLFLLLMRLHIFLKNYFVNFSYILDMSYFSAIYTASIFSQSIIYIYLNCLNGDFWWTVLFNFIEG